MTYEGIDNDALTLRDKLARDRTMMANERTLLAYVRTSILLGVSSVSLLKLFPDNSLTMWTAIGLVPVVIAVALLGIRRFARFSRAMAELKK